MVQSCQKIWMWPYKGKTRVSFSQNTATYRKCPETKPTTERQKDERKNFIVKAKWYAFLKTIDRSDTKCQWLKHLKGQMRVIDTHR